MSYFTKEALEKFQELCAEGVDFGEEGPYDFVMCLMTNGDVYGIEPGETCEKGKQISDKQGAALKAKKKGKGKKSSAARMAILKKAFLKKTGREMTKEELAKAAWLVNKGK